DNDVALDSTESNTLSGKVADGDDLADQEFAEVMETLEATDAEAANLLNGVFAADDAAAVETASAAQDPIPADELSHDPLTGKLIEPESQSDPADDAEEGKQSTSREEPSLD
ncbi:MAG: hypothetical protein AAGB01_06470, partial [Cyanobacteria bacterium P01_F01_bin.42]